jgi:Aph-1 protein
MMFAGLLAGDASPFRFALIVTLAVILEEAVRWWLYTIHRYASQVKPAGSQSYSVLLLSCRLDSAGAWHAIWRSQHRRTPVGASVQLTRCMVASDGAALCHVHRRLVEAQHASFSICQPVAQVLLGFAIGYGQAVAHVLVFSVSWLPLTAGKGVLYAGGCSSMSHALAAALTMLGFFLLHAGSTVIAFDGAAQKHWVQAAVPGIVHLAAALLTVLNVRHNSCAAVGGIIIAVGSAMMVWAAYVYYRQKAAPQAYERVPNERPGVDDQT